jgi:hypothetical protein
LKEIQEEEEEGKEQSKQVQRVFLIQPNFFIKQFNKDDNIHEDKTTKTTKTTKTSTSKIK